MRPLWAVLAAVVLAGGPAMAAEMRPVDAPVGNEVGAPMKDNRAKEGVVMDQGKMMMLKDGNKMIMEENMTMRNGTVITKEGAFMMRDGSKLNMREGDWMDLDGNLIPHLVRPRAK